MDERANPSSPDPAALPAVRGPWHPARRGAGRGEHPAPDGAASAGVGGARPRPDSPWRRLVRTRRGAAGLGVGAAAILLWPFAGWSWWPWAAGGGALALLWLLRLDRLLRGWTWLVGGLVVVVGLMLSTGPWAWAMAAGIGVLLAGLVQLPFWRLAAVGAVMCLVSGVGFTMSQYRSAEQVTAQQVRTQLENRGRLGAARPTGVLPVLLNAVARGETGAVCDSLLTASARNQFVAAAAQPDCPAAVRALSGQVVDRPGYAKAVAPTVRDGDRLEVDACRLTWPALPVAGPRLGRLTVGRAQPGTTYVVTAFRPCS